MPGSRAAAGAAATAGVGAATPPSSAGFLLRPPRLRRRRRLVAGGASSLDSDAPRADSVASLASPDAAAELAGTVTGAGEVSCVASWGLFGSDKAREYGPVPYPRPPRGNDPASVAQDSAYTRPRAPMIFPLLIGAGVAAGTYWYAKSQKKASSGKSAAAAAVTGAAGWGTAALVAAAWPILLVGGVGAGIYYAVKKNDQKALPPARD